MNNKNPQNLSPKDLHNWLHKNSSPPLLVDVREKNELKIAPFPFSVLHFPLSQMENWIEDLPHQLPKDRPIVVICHAGIRSWNFGTWLLQQGWGYEVWNLQGGIDAWSEKVDPKVLRY